VTRRKRLVTGSLKGWARQLYVSGVLPAAMTMFPGVRGRIAHLTINVDAQLGARRPLLFLGS